MFRRLGNPDGGQCSDDDFDDVFGRSDATGYGNAGFLGRGPLFKITDSVLDIVDDFDFGMPTPPNVKI